MNQGTNVQEIRATLGKSIKTLFAQNKRFSYVPPKKNDKEAKIMLAKKNREKYLNMSITIDSDDDEDEDFDDPFGSNSLTE